MELQLQNTRVHSRTHSLMPNFSTTHKNQYDIHRPLFCGPLPLQKPLAPYSPLAKFLVVKITLFFTFWQEIVLSSIESELLECFDKSSPFYNSHQIMSSIEVCGLSRIPFLYPTAHIGKKDFPSFVLRLNLYLTWRVVLIFCPGEFNFHQSTQQPNFSQLIRHIRTRSSALRCC